MPNYTYCMNCFKDKTPDRFGERLCLNCEEVSNQAAEFAHREGLDAGAARKAALASHAPHAMDHKHPSMHFDRVSTTALAERLAQRRPGPGERI